MKPTKTCLAPVLLALVFSLTACAGGASGTTAQAASMTIRPAALSAETQRALADVDSEALLFDYAVDDSVKSATVKLWLHKDGGWTEGGVICTNMEQGEPENRIAIGTTDGAYRLALSGTGGERQQSTIRDSADFSAAELAGWTALAQPETIVPDQEIPLWVKCSSDKDSLEVVRDSEKFRTTYCTAGAAITVTFSDKTAAES